MEGVRGGNQGSPALRSGCPDSNRGPRRPERRALPGCATPRTTRGYLLWTRQPLHRATSGQLRRLHSPSKRTAAGLAKPPIEKRLVNLDVAADERLAARVVAVAQHDPVLDAGSGL